MVLEEAGGGSFYRRASGVDRAPPATPGHYDGVVMTHKYRGSIVALFDKYDCRTQRGAEGNDKWFSARYSLQTLKLSVTNSSVIR